MLNSVPISNIKYLCFGCEKCKGTENELFVYICAIYNKVYLGTKEGRVYFFYITESATCKRLYGSIFNNIKFIPKERNMSERITSFSELMERIKGCG